MQRSHRSTPSSSSSYHSSISLPSASSLIGQAGDALAATTSYVDGLLGGLTDGIGGMLGGAQRGAAPASPAAAPQAPGSGAAPATDAETTEPAAAQPTALPYLSQYDNEFTNDQGVAGKNMCTVTSMAMHLIALCGGADAVKQQTAALIGEHGGTPPDNLPSRQTEDVLMMLFDILRTTGYWDTKLNETTLPFQKNWIAGVPEGDKYHQAGVCQAHVMPWFSAVKSAVNLSPSEEKKATNQAFFLETIRPRLATTVFLLSTKLTKGHFVALVDVLDDGIIINDPAGAHGPGAGTDYLYNGEALGATRAADATWRKTLAVRFREQPERLAQLEDPTALRGDWGERNYFTWAEVEYWNIGKFVTGASH